MSEARLRNLQKIEVDFVVARALGSSPSPAATSATSSLPSFPLPPHMFPSIFSHELARNGNKVAALKEPPNRVFQRSRNPLAFIHARKGAGELNVFDKVQNLRKDSLAALVRCGEQAGTSERFFCGRRGNAVTNAGTGGVTAPREKELKESEHFHHVGARKLGREEGGWQGRAAPRRLCPRKNDRRNQHPDLPLHSRSVLCPVCLTRRARRFAKTFARKPTFSSRRQGAEGARDARLKELQLLEHLAHFRKQAVADASGSLEEGSEVLAEPLEEARVPAFGKCEKRRRRRLAERGWRR